MDVDGALSADKENYYAVLGLKELGPDATDDQIKRACEDEVEGKGGCVSHTRRRLPARRW